MDKPEIIDAEFRVISSGRQVAAYQEPDDLMSATAPIKAPPMRFWADDFPTLLGFVVAGLLGIAFKLYFHVHL